MKIQIKKRIAFVLVLIIVVGAFTIATLCVEAKGYTGMKNAGDSTYIVKSGSVQRGWTWYKGRHYYCHETDSEMHPVGSVFKGGLKLINQKVYCFDSRGRQVRKDTHYVKLNTDKSVKHLYIPGTNHRQRYSTKYFRYQFKRHGRWLMEEGMPFHPYGLISTQR